MLGRVTVPLFPFRTRAGQKFDYLPGTTVKVYNAQGDGSPAVREDGVVPSTATAAYVYYDRLGSKIMTGAIPIDDIGGPIDTFRTGQIGPVFSFYGFPGVYHLLVTMPDGSTFGIPHVRVPFDPLSWTVCNIHEMYNDTDTGASPLNSPFVNKQVGTDLAADNNVARVIAQKSTVGVAATSLWQGDEPWTNGQEHPGAPDSTETGGAADGASIFKRPLIIQASQYVDIAKNVAAGMMAGISMGYSAAAGAAIPANPTKPLLALYSEWLTRTYVLYVAKGSGSGNTATQTLTNLSFTAQDPGDGLGTGAMDRLQIRFNPNGKVIEGWVNGWFGGRITTAAAFPPTDATNVQEGFNTFAISGATASANISAAWWNCRYWIGM